MHIIFWSCMPGHSAVSCNLLSVACDCSGYQKFSTGILQTQFKKNNLQYPFFKLADKENVEQYNTAGMDALIRTVRGGSMGGGVETCAISFMGSKLSVYPQSINFDGRAYYNSLLSVMPKMMDALDKAFDITLIDTAAGNDPVSVAALQLADVIVVCLPQEDWIIHYFFDKYKLDKSKVFYLFGNYDRKLTVNIPTLAHSKQYKGKITSKNSAYIAHDVDFANAVNSSELIPYYVRGMECGKSSPNYTYFSSVHAATRKLLAFAGIPARK